MLTRPVSPSFDDAMVIELQNKIGIVDDYGEIIDGYELWVQHPGDQPRCEFDPPLSYVNQTTRLFFEFEGLPTQDTMRVLESLLSEYTTSRMQRLLNYLRLAIPKYLKIA